MKVAIVHDDLVQWGGAERVLMGICEIFPDAPIYTSVFAKNNKLLLQSFGSKKVITSFLQKIPGWKTLYKSLLPLYPIAFEQFNFDQFDLVISHTTRFAKSIISKPKTFHISFVHTPPRFLWHLSGEKNYRLGELLMTKLRIYDQISAKRVDYFLAGSENAKRRIKKLYGVESKVVYPFVDLDRFKDVESFDGGYFLVIARASGYKRVDLAIEACIQLGLSLKIIGKGDKGNMEKGGGIEFLGELDDQMVMKVLEGCKALIIPGEEDFGLVSIEAQALGKPIIAFKGGGNLETVIDDKTGTLFDSQTIQSLKRAIIRLEKSKIKAADCIENARRFSKEKFKKKFQQTLTKLGYTI